MRRRIQVEAEKPQFCVTTGITFAQADAWFGNTVQDLKLDLIYPRDNTRKYPCVVWICGGAWIQMDRSAHLAYLSVLAQQGFVVASVEYRTSNEAKFPAPLQDVKAGIRYLRAHADRFNIDPDRIGVMGESAGGYLTCMAALATDPVYDVGENLEYSSAVQAACPWYPPTDFRGFQYSDPEQCAASPESLLMGKNVMRHPEEALACCPVSFVTKAAPPFLIIHGEDDHTVPFGQGEELHDELEKAGCDVTLFFLFYGDPLHHHHRGCLQPDPLFPDRTGRLPQYDVTIQNAPAQDPERGRSAFRPQDATRPLPALAATRKGDLSFGVLLWCEEESCARGRLRPRPLVSYSIPVLWARMRSFL